MKCAFVGLEPKFLPFRCREDDPAYDDLTQRLIKEIVNLCEQGVKEYTTGMESGAGLLCCEVALAMKENDPDVKVHAVIPFRRYADELARDERAWYAFLLKQCDSVVYLFEEYMEGCVAARNRRIIDDADILLAVCEPDRIPTHSEVGEAVQYARLKGKRVVFVPPVIS